MKNVTSAQGDSSLLSSPYAVRIYNDQLLQLERAFLNPLGQGGDLADMKYAVVVSMMLSFVFLFLLLDMLSTPQPKVTSMLHQVFQA